MPKLYDVPRNSRIKILADNDRHPPAHRDFVVGEELFFHHTDGMYSFCMDKDNNVVHLAAYSEVEVLEDADET